MVLEKIYLCFVTLVPLLQIVLALDTDSDRYGRKFKPDAPYLSALRETTTIGDICKILVGCSKGTFCPVEQQHNSNLQHLPRSCKEIQQSGQTASGIYTISPNANNNSLTVLCDLEIRGGGWTHIQKRFDGSEDFYRPWREYKFGFGNLRGEFWMGLENIYQLTGSEASELLIELIDKDKLKYYAYYTGFAIGPEVDGYLLKTASGFSGNTGDSLEYQLGQQFSTFDLDRDQWDTGNCGEYSMGGWWYNNCYSSNLNGKLRNMKHTEVDRRKGMNWDKLSTNGYFLYGSRMLVRPNQHYHQN